MAAQIFLLEKRRKKSPYYSMYPFIDKIVSTMRRDVLSCVSHTCYLFHFSFFFLISELGGTATPS